MTFQQILNFLFGATINYNLVDFIIKFLELSKNFEWIG